MKCASKKEKGRQISAMLILRLGVSTTVACASEKGMMDRANFWAEDPDLHR